MLVAALRQYLETPSAPLAVREPSAPSYEPGAPASAPYSPPADAAAEVAASRRHHLRAELALPPLERLQRAEQLARLGQPANLPRPSAQVVGFDSYEDYYEWKKSRLIRA